MKKQLNLKKVNSTDGLERIDRQEVRLLWSHDWWDGPISGMMMYQGQMYWFQLFINPENPNSEQGPRRYLVIELSKDELEEKEYWQNLFLEKVGPNNVFDENGVRRTDRPRQPSEMRHGGKTWGQTCKSAILITLSKP